MGALARPGRSGDAGGVRAAFSCCCSRAHAGGLARGHRRPVPDLPHPVGRSVGGERGAYTLYSIAAVVLGGVSLFGGSGSAIGAIFGALAFRAIGDLLFVFDIEPLWQPLFQGLVLLASVSIGATRLIGVRNRLDLFG